MLILLVFLVRKVFFVSATDKTNDKLGYFMVLSCTLSLSQGFNSTQCALCECLGDVSELLFCTGCGSHYHSSCLEPPIQPNPTIRIGWQCAECKTCLFCKWVFSFADDNAETTIILTSEILPYLFRLFTFLSFISLPSGWCHEEATKMSVGRMSGWPVWFLSSWQGIA